MITVEEILSKYSKANGPIERNPRAIVKATEALEAMLEFAKEAIKADRINLLEHVEVVEGWNTGFSGSAGSIDKDSLLNAPNIELL